MLKDLLGAIALIASAQATDIRSLVDQYADRHGVPRNIAHAVIVVESNYRPGLRGDAGEYGIGQILCPTARGEGFTGDCSRLLDPETNLNFSMSYLAKALAKGGQGCNGITLYNTGIHIAPHCSAYGRRVLANMGK